MACKIYLVEDSPVIRDNLIDFLEDVSDVVVLACDATERAAVAWLGAHPHDWDLLIVDLFLVQGNGFGVLQAAAQRLPQQKVVVLSNYVTADMRSRAQALGADAFLDKSTDLEMLQQWCMRAGGNAAVGSV